MTAADYSRAARLPVVKTGQTIRLPDGRRLGYAEFGAAGGRPVFLFHGFNASRLMRHPDDNLTASLDVRLIALDRPGVGLSTPQRGRSLLDWPGDVVQLADVLGIERFAVLGHSWGGPFALACAFAIPQRLNAAGVVSGMSGWLVGRGSVPDLSPGFRKLATIMRVAPGLVRLGFWQSRRQRRRRPAWVVDRAIAQMPPCDRAVVTHLDMRAMFVAMLMEPWRQGVDGMYSDIMAVSRPWGFAVEDIAGEIKLWYGAADPIIRAEMTQHLIDALPRCTATCYPHEGHLILFAHWAEILMALTAPAHAAML